MRKQTWSGFCGRNSEGGVGMAGMPYPTTKTPTDCTDVHRGRFLSARRFCGFCVFRGRFLSEAMLVQQRLLHPLKTSVSICAICGRLLSARRFCGVCVFRGRFLSEAMLVQRRPLHPLKVATLQQQYCHATTTRLPRYDNKVATLRQNVERRM